MKQRPVTRASFQTCLHAVYRFYRFLDEMEDVAEAAGEQFQSPCSVVDIPGTIWMLFKTWLGAGNSSAHYEYFHWRRVFEVAALQRAAASGCAVPGFPLPINPFPNPQKSAAMRPATVDVTLSDEESRAISEVLFERVQRTTTRISAQRDAIASSSERGLYLRKWLELVEENEWRTEDMPMREVARINDFLGIPESDLEDLGRNDKIAAGFWIMPSHNEIMLAFALVMLRTGWNTSTTRDIDCSNWWKPHPTSPQIVEVFSRKSRANGNVQRSYSRRQANSHPFQLLTQVLGWNEPLRAALVAERNRLKETTRSGSQETQLRLKEIAQIIRRVWLFLATDYRFFRDRPPISCLIDDVSYDVVNEVLKSTGLLLDGKPLRFKQEVSRATWAGFAFETSGNNLLVTQLATGHRRLESVLSYINQRGIRNKNRKRWFGLQTQVLTELENGRLNPRILRVLVNKGSISEAEAARLATSGVRTRHGVLCSDPHHPDAAVDPNHKAGGLCGTQACLEGCSKAFATFESLQYVARRIVQLRRIRLSIPGLAWVESNHPHDLDLLEQFALLFSQENQRRAFELAEVSTQE